MTTQTQNNTPHYNVYFVDDTDKEPRWIRIGAARDNLDERGVSLKIDAMPMDFKGELVLRKSKAKGVSA